MVQVHGKGGLGGAVDHPLGQAHRHGGAGEEFGDELVGGGVEAEIWRGTASVMVNGTTESEMPAYWVAASWRMSF